MAATVPMGNGAGEGGKRFMLNALVIWLEIPISGREKILIDEFFVFLFKRA